MFFFQSKQTPAVINAISEAGLPFTSDAATGGPLCHKFSKRADKSADFEQFRHFFSSLVTKESKSWKTTKEVLEKKVKLHLLASEVQTLVIETSLKGEELNNTKRSLSYWQKKMGEFGAKMETMPQFYNAKDNMLVEKDKLKNLEEDIKGNIKEADDHAIAISCYVRELNEIALRPDPFMAPQTVDQTIEAEQREQQPGFQERIEGFKRLRKLAVITSSPFNVLNDVL